MYKEKELKEETLTKRKKIVKEAKTYCNIH